MTLPELKLLLIEDDLEDAEILQVLIEEISRPRCHYTLHTFTSIEDSAAEVDACDFDLILLDLNLLHTQGVETLDVLHKTFKNIPGILVLTNQSDRETALECIRRGASDFLLKGKITSQLLERAFLYSHERHKLIKELSEKNEKLLTALTELEKYAFIASHELRSPIRSLVGLAQLVLKDNTERLNETSINNLECIIAEGKKMHMITANLLAYAQLNIENNTDENVDLGTCMDQLLESLGTNIINDCFIYDGLPAIKGNREEIILVFENLITNSIQYCSDQRELKVEVICIEHPDHLQIEFKDNGVGIPSDYLEKIFRPFERLTNVQDEQSQGIGLSLCKKIMEKHGGEISARSDGVTGTTFVLSFPKR